MKGLEAVDERLVDAIQDARLPDVLRELNRRPDRLDEGARARVAEASAAVAAIDAAVHGEEARLGARLAEAGVRGASWGDARTGRPIHALALHVASRDDVVAAAAALEDASYRRLGPAHEAAWRAHRATHAACAFVRTDREPFRVELRWPAPLPGAAARLLAPNLSDLEAIRLPARLWPAYSAVRLLRLPARLLGRAWAPPDLGPFLTTPDALIEPLLRFAGVTPEDRLVDLGCGDGRIPIRAAEAFGCRARGIERDAALVEEARAAAAAAGLADRVEIVRADAAAASLDDATVVVAFLPVATIESQLPSILGRMRRGARLVAHEQTRLRAAGARSAPLLSPGGISVAHRWDR